MRGDVVYHVYGVHAARDEDVYLGAFRTVFEAEAEIAKLKTREIDDRNWADQYHNRGFITREVVVETDFEVPTRPAPRDKYFVKLTEKTNPGAWSSTLVDVFRRSAPVGDAEKVCRYERNYATLQTFEPFRQQGREFALISRDYTATAVLDLTSGEVVELASPMAADSAPLASTCLTGRMYITKPLSQAANTGRRIMNGRSAILVSSGAVTGVTTIPGKSSILT